MTASLHRLHVPSISDDAERGEYQAMDLVQQAKDFLRAALGLSVDHDEDIQAALDSLPNVDSWREQFAIDMRTGD